MSEKTHGNEFDLGRLAAVCLKRWWIVAGCVLAGFLAALLICTCLITPLYRSEVSFYVGIGSGEEETLSASGLTAASLLADTCIGLLDSDTVLEQIAASAGTELTADELRPHLEGDRVGETPLLRVGVLNSDPQTAAKLAEAVTEVLPHTAETLARGCTLQVVDHARVPGEPDSPDTVKACVLGAFAGLVLAVAGLAFSLLWSGRRNTVCER